MCAVLSVVSCVGAAGLVLEGALSSGRGHIREMCEHSCSSLFDPARIAELNAGTCFNFGQITSECLSSCWTFANQLLGSWCRDHARIAGLTAGTCLNVRLSCV